MPVGLISSGHLYYVHPDHLGSPRTITDSSNNVLWTWANDSPFGDNSPLETGISTYNLRFPGQYFDNETKLNYNLNRDYNSNTGRYVQTDPIGLNGGLNLYNYAAGNSLINFDSTGFDAVSNFEKGTVNQMYSNIKMNHFKNDDRVFFYDSEGGLNVDGIPTIGSSSNYLNAQAFSNLFIQTPYFKRRSDSNQSIIIILYACQTGSKLGNYEAFGDYVSQYVTSILRSQGKDNDVYVLAPNGYLPLVPAFGGEIETPLNYPTDNEPVISYWNTFENGALNRSLQFKSFNYNNPIFGR